MAEKSPGSVHAPGAVLLPVQRILYGLGQFRSEYFYGNLHKFCAEILCKLEIFLQKYCFF